MHLDDSISMVKITTTKTTIKITIIHTYRNGIVKLCGSTCEQVTKANFNFVANTTVGYPNTQQWG